MQNTERKLATVRIIRDLTAIQGADKIELAHIDGWQVVVKKGEYTVGQQVVYLEVDSWVPDSIAPFLTKPSHSPKVYEGVEGQRLTTVKLRGELSQGLVLPLSVSKETTFVEGADLTYELGILKWEKPIPAALAGFAKGYFPTWLKKTDQERIQNLNRTLENPEGALQGYAYEVTEKLHGTSATFGMMLLEDGSKEFVVCSRNLSLKLDEENASNLYVKMAQELDMQNILGCFFDGTEPAGSLIAIQGEICGPGINGNQYGLTKPEFFVFDIQGNFPGISGFCTPSTRRDFCADASLQHVPYLGDVYINAQTTVQSLLTQAEGASSINGSNRAGLVYKRVDNQCNNVSFKCISNQWIISGGEEQ